MKIAFVGKGGSGKSSVSSLFSKYLAKNNKYVFAIDADINQHFGNLLGFSEEELKNLPSLGHEIENVKKYVWGENKKIKSLSHLRMTTPPGTGSKVVHPNKNDPLLTKYIISKDGINFATTGEFEQNDVGMICYHGKTLGTEIVLNHLADSKDEYIILDMTAGADAFSTGIFLKFDLIVLVVEPTAQSLSVYTQYKEYGKEYGINIKVIGNKIDEKEDEDFITRVVKDDYVGSIPFSKEIRKLEQGKEISEDFKLVLDNVFSNLLNKINKLEKDWDKFYRNLVNLHLKHAESWLNSSFQTKFEEQIDKDFDPVKFFSR